MKSRIITLLFILITIAVIIFIVQKNGNNTNADLAKCIASKSTLYVATGCVACEYQEELFGENLKYLNVIDCAVTPEKCDAIIENGYISTPTWIINGEKIIGAQSIEKLKELTGC